MLFCKTCCILWGIAVHGNQNSRLSKSRFTNQLVRKYQERLDKTCFFSNSVDKYIVLQSAMELSSPMAEPKSNGLRQNPIVWQGFRYDMKFFNFAVLYRKHLKNVLPFNYLFSLAKPDKKSTGVNSIPVFPHFVKNVDLWTACYFHPVKFELIVQRYPWRRHNVTSQTFLFRHHRTSASVSSTYHRSLAQTIALLGLIDIYVYIYHPYTFLRCIQLCNRLSKNH